jgi:hypothetical protein
MPLQKPVVTFGGVALAGNGAVVWMLRTGVDPYQTVVQVHESMWSEIQGKLGEPQELSITDSQGETLSFKEVYALHRVASSSPYRVSFLISDKRWLWPHKLIVRDYNVPRKTGNRTLFNENLPIETSVTVDEYHYTPASLKPGEESPERWTAEEVIENVLEAMDQKDEGGSPKGFRIESWPIKDDEANGISEQGTFAIQNLMLRDASGQALARALGFVPGAGVYVAADGKTVVYDAADLDITKNHFDNLPPNSYEGQKAVVVDRSAIRPKEIRVHYQREVELLLSFKDDYAAQTAARPDRDEPYLENCIPTVDTSTTTNEYDPVKDRMIERTVPAGTWVEFRGWLEAMDKIKPANSWPWNFKTLKTVWLAGDLDGALGANEGDQDPNGNVSMRVQAIKQHFRQTYRLNQRYARRFRDIRATRVGVLDPVTGARAPAAVWGQATVIPTRKGQIMGARQANLDAEKYGIWRVIDTVGKFEESNDDTIATYPPSPARVVILDKDLGILRVDWIISPYGIDTAHIPSLVTDETGDCSAGGEYPRRDLKFQDNYPMSPNSKIADTENGLWLCDKMQMRMMVTIVPMAPNNKNQFHYKDIKASEIAEVFQREYKITGGKAPRLDIWVAPNEVTARFGWKSDEEAKQTFKELMGLDEDAQGTGGFVGPGSEIGLTDPSDMENGFTFINELKEISDHAKSYAAQVLATYADAIQGSVTTQLESPVRIRGNISQVAVSVAAAPSGKIRMTHGFPGRQQPINRFAMLPESTRRLLLGIPIYSE